MSEELTRQSQRELAVTMTDDAADRLWAALSWATAVASIRAEEWDDVPGREDRAAQFREHADWLRWGLGRLQAAGYDPEARGRV